MRFFRHHFQASGGKECKKPQRSLLLRAKRFLKNFDQNGGRKRNGLSKLKYNAKEQLVLTYDQAL